MPCGFILAQCLGWGETGTGFVARIRGAPLCNFPLPPPPCLGRAPLRAIKKII